MKIIEDKQVFYICTALTGRKMLYQIKQIKNTNRYYILDSLENQSIGRFDDWEDEEIIIFLFGTNFKIKASPKQMFTYYGEI